MTAPIGVGIIGAGGISRSHARAYQRLPDVKIVGVADIIGDRARAAADEWGAPYAFDNVADLVALPEIEAVSVCTFNQAHRPAVIAALEAGKPVLVEKPLAATLDDAVAMIRAANRSKAFLQTGFWPRFQPEVMAAKQIVESGALGDLYYAQMVGGRRRGIPGGSFLRKDMAGAGPIVDIGCYDLDRFMFLAGGPVPTHVSAMVSHKLGKSLPNVPGDWKHDPSQVEVEDMGVAFVRFESGLVLHFITYWAIHADDLGPSVLLGTKGGLQVSHGLTLFRDEFGTMTNVTPQLPNNEEPQRLHHFVPQARRFIDAVRAGGPSPVGTHEILMSQLIMDGIFRSAEAGHEVAIEVPDVS